MTMPNHHTGGTICNLVDRLQRFADAGIDPAFDAETEELERQFAEYRCNIVNN